MPRAIGWLVAAALTAAGCVSASPAPTSTPGASLWGGIVTVGQAEQFGHSEYTRVGVGFMIPPCDESECDLAGCGAELREPAPPSKSELVKVVATPEMGWGYTRTDLTLTRNPALERVTQRGSAQKMG